MRLTITIDIDKSGKVSVDVQSDDAKLTQKPAGKQPKRHTCAQCKKPYMRYRSDSNFCSKKCYQRYYNVSHGRIKQAVERQPQQAVVITPRPESIQFTPAPIAIVPQRPTQAVSAGAFLDPWNCQKCRDKQALCSLHEALTADGRQPPQFHHYRT